jgi:hypothetical protein|tara:strand:- start:209 stop:430 length:222 start_codon:yes stop_codon:yes gene_type:complete
MFSKQCKAHLEEIKLGPIAHLIRAWKIGFTFLLLFPVMIIHGLVPRWFTTTATDYMSKLMNIKSNELKQKSNK